MIGPVLGDDVGEARRRCRAPARVGGEASLVWSVLSRDERGDAPQREPEDREEAEPAAHGHDGAGEGGLELRATHRLQCARRRVARQRDRRPRTQLVSGRARRS